MNDYQKTRCALALLLLAGLLPCFHRHRGDGLIPLICMALSFVLFILIPLLMI